MRVLGHGLVGPFAVLQVIDGARLGGLARVRIDGLEAQAANGGVVVDRVAQERDAQRAEVEALVGSVARRPVAMRLDAVALDEVGQHDDDGRRVLPHHLPKVLEGVGQRSLARNVGRCRGRDAVDVARVDVVRGRQRARRCDRRQRR